MRNPYGFPKFEHDFISFRYARTKPIEGYIPALVVFFVIDPDGTVVLNWVETYDEG